MSQEQQDNDQLQNDEKFQNEDSKVENKSSYVENQDNKKKVSPIQILYKIVQLKQQSNPEIAQLHIEKMLQFAIQELEYQRETLQSLPFNFTTYLVECVQKLNVQAIQNSNTQNDKEGIIKIIKAVDLISNRNLNKYVDSIQKLDEIKQQTFQNLAHIYQLQGKSNYALKAISYAIQIQEKIQNVQNKFDIITLYLNKGAIQNSLKKHEKALDSLNKALNYLRQLECKNEKEINDMNSLKVVAFYNIGAENEHLLHKDKAQMYYKEGLKLAQESQQQSFVQKFEDALKNFQ